MKRVKTVKRQPPVKTKSTKNDLLSLISDDEEEDDYIYKDQEVKRNESFFTVSDEDADDDETTNLLFNQIATKYANKKGQNRSEAAENVSEFNLIKKDTDKKDSFKKLLKSNLSGKDKVLEKIKKKSNEKKSKDSKKKEAKTLDAPLEKPVQDKIKRKLSYHKAKQEVSKWNSLVYSNRVAEQVFFPLDANDKTPKWESKDEEGFMPETSFEQEIAKVLHGEEYLKKLKEGPKPKTHDEMIEISLERHKELARIRALQSYEMAKAKRQKKIKSKKFHRLLKRERVRKEVKEFELLQKVDPDKALEKLEEINQSRVKERMTLKHKNTGKWAKNQIIRAKYNEEARMAIAEQLKISKQLTAKKAVSSDEEEDPDLDLPHLVQSSMDNPWMLSGKSENKMHLYYTGYRKLWEEINQKKESELKKEMERLEAEKVEIGEIKENSDSDESEAEDDSNSEDEGIDEETERNGTRRNSKKAKRKKSEFTGMEVEDLNVNDRLINFELSDDEFEGEKNKKGTSLEDKREEKKKPVMIDPKNFIKLGGSKLKFDFTDNINEEEESGSEEEDEQRELLAEAFADDNVIEEFEKRKGDLKEEDTPMDLDLPGWGSWAGAGIDPSMRKQREKKPKAPLPKRKDDGLPHVIYNEEPNEQLKAHLVREVPFPFNRAKDFERMVRAPIGRTWMPENAVKSLTAPKVITRLGTVIRPISTDVLLKKPGKLNLQDFRR